MCVRTTSGANARIRSAIETSDVAVDLEGIVPEIETLELGAERGRRPLCLSVPDLLHALDGLPLLLP